MRQSELQGGVGSMNSVAQSLAFGSARGFDGSAFWPRAR
jgi:hypothetical protein